MPFNLLTTSIYSKERECTAWNQLPFEMCHIFNYPSQLDGWGFHTPGARMLQPPEAKLLQLQQQQHQVSATISSTVTPTFSISTTIGASVSKSIEPSKTPPPSLANSVDTLTLEDFQSLHAAAATLVDVKSGNNSEERNKDVPFASVVEQLTLNEKDAIFT